MKTQDFEIIEDEKQELRLHQNLPFAIGTGLVAAVLMAGLWCGVTVLTGYQIGYMAIAIGFVVGFVIRKTGKGVDQSFGIAGAVLALIGCLLGNLLSIAAFTAIELEVSFTDILTNLNVEQIVVMMKEFFSPIDLLFYAIAIGAGYRYSVIKTTPKVIPVEVVEEE